MQGLAGIATMTSLAEVGLAVSVAYIGLERFRYRKKIRESASKVFSDRCLPLPERYQIVEQYLTVAYLRNLQDDGSEDAQFSLGDLKKIGWLRTGEGRAYRHLFARHQDRAAVVFLGLMCVLTLISAVSIANEWRWALIGIFLVFASLACASAYYFSYRKFSYFAAASIVALTSASFFVDFYLWDGYDAMIERLLVGSVYLMLILAIIMPAVLIGIGQWVVRTALEKIEGCANDLLQLQHRKAVDVEVQSGIEGAVSRR